MGEDFWKEKIGGWVRIRGRRDELVIIIFFKKRGKGREIFGKVVEDLNIICDWRDIFVGWFCYIIRVLKGMNKRINKGSRVFD